MKLNKWAITTTATLALSGLLVMVPNSYAATNDNTSVSKENDKGIPDRVAALEQKFSSLQSTVTAQQNEISTLNDNVSNQQKQVNSILSTVSDLQVRLNGMNTTVTNQQNDVSTMKTDIAEIESKLTDMNNQLSAVQTQLSNQGGGQTQPPSQSTGSSTIHSVQGDMVDVNGKPFFSGFALIDTKSNQSYNVDRVNGGFAASVPDGTYNIYFYFPGYQLASPQQVTVSGSDATGVHIRLSVPTFTVSGQALDSTGKPLTGQGVTLKDTRGDVGGYWKPVQQDGSFTLDGIAPGSYVVQIGDPSNPSVTASLTVADSDVTGVQIVQH